MKNLIVYYSLTGFSEQVASELSKSLGCKSIKIMEVGKRPSSGFFLYFVGGFQAITKRTVKIEPIAIDLSEYERTILFTPIWAGHLPPATRTFLSQYKDKINKLEVVSVSGLGDKNQAFKKDIEDMLKKEPIDCLFLTEAEVKNGDYKEKLKKFMIIEK